MKKLLSVLIIAIMLIASVSVSVSAATTLEITKSASEVLVGNEVDVTFVFKDSEVIGGIDALISFDSTKLSFVSHQSNELGSGEITLLGKTIKVLVFNSSSTLKTVKVTLRFKTLAVGEASVSINTTEVTDVEGVALGAPSGSTKIAIKQENKSNNANLKWLTVPKGCTLVPAFSKDVTEYTCTVPGSVTSFPMDWDTEDSKATDKVSGNLKLSVGENKRSVTVTAEDGTKKVYTVTITRLKPEATPTPTPTPTPTQKPTQTPIPTPTSAPVTVLVDGEEYSIVKDITLELPKGYTTQTVTYNSVEIQGAVLGNVTLVQLNNGLRDGLFVYNADENSFEYFKTLASLSEPLTVLSQKPAAVSENAKDIHMVIGEGEYTVWECAVLGDGYFYIHVMNSLGEAYPAIYCEADGSIQKLSDKLVEAKADGEAIIETPVPDVTKTKKTDWVLIGLIAGGLVLLALIIVIIVLLARGKKKPKPERDWGFNSDPYDIDIESEAPASEAPKKKMKKIDPDDEDFG